MRNEVVICGILSCVSFGLEWLFFLQMLKFLLMLVFWDDEKLVDVTSCQGSFLNLNP